MAKDSDGFNPNLEGPEHDAEEKARAALCELGLVDVNGNCTGNVTPKSEVKITVKGGMVWETEATDENVEIEVNDLDV